MAKRFKLHAVLKYRQTLENQAQQVLGKSLQQQTQLQSALQECHASLHRHDTELKKRQRQGMALMEMELFESQIQHCRFQAHRIQKKLEQLEKQIADERAELLKAARERQIMEKLRDKQEAEYQREVDRKERDMLDEISLRRNGEES